jgi:putative MATE family efflux protein
MSVPTIISMLVTSIYNIVDTYFVGTISTQATAAVGIVFAVMSVIQAIGFLFGQGSGTYISRKLGARELDDARRMASTAFFSSLLFGILIAAVGLSFLTPLSVLLGSTPTILPYTKQYMGVILIGAPFMTSSMTLNNQMRFQGNASYAMYGMLAGATLNLILVPLFIFVFHWGILGAAIGTLIGQIFSFIILFAITFRGGSIRISPSQFSFAREYFVQIFQGGTPSLTRQGLASISTTLLNVAAGAYGDAAIAGMSIVTRISFVILSIVIGIGQGYQPLCGFCYGAHLYHRVRSGYFFSVKISFVFLILCSVSGYCFAEPIIYLFRHDPAVVSVGAAAFRWQLISFPLISVIMLSNMMLQTTGNSISANILAASRNGIFFIPLIILLPRLYGLLGVEMCQAAADVLSFILAIPLAWQLLHQMKG